VLARTPARRALSGSFPRRCSAEPAGALHRFPRAG